MCRGRQYVQITVCMESASLAQLVDLIIHMQDIPLTMAWAFHHYLYWIPLSWLIRLCQQHIHPILLPSCLRKFPIGFRILMLRAWSIRTQRQRIQTILLKWIILLLNLCRTLRILHTINQIELLLFVLFVVTIFIAPYPWRRFMTCTSHPPLLFTCGFAEWYRLFGDYEDQKAFWGHGRQFFCGE